MKKLTYSQRLAGYERDKAAIPRGTDWKTYEQTIKQLTKKWRI